VVELLILPLALFALLAAAMLALSIHVFILGSASLSDCDDR